ncbi:MAG: CinA family protein [Oscillospiraceae bacterium]|nr:CinA family protein [Oscillospiraceae bacterium]
MMTNLSSDVIKVLQGKTLATAESCTGGGIGTALTAVPGSSAVYKGGIISYTNWVKEKLLGVPAEMLERNGAVSEPVARAMAEGARRQLKADIAVSATGLAGPGGDEYGNPVGTVFIGYADVNKSFANEYHFIGDREEVRNQAIQAVLQIVLQENK